MRRLKIPDTTIWAVLLSLFVIKYLGGQAFLVVGLLLSLSFLNSFIGSKSQFSRVFFSNGLGIVFVLTVFEVYCELSRFTFVPPRKSVATSSENFSNISRPALSPTHHQIQNPSQKLNLSFKGISRTGTYNTDYFEANEFLGYLAKPGVFRSRFENSKILVYDVSYSIGSSGFRKIPPKNIPLSESLNAILFFGCSFTIGEGVPDNAPFASIVDQLAGAQYRSWNFGFHGFGPHQMLSILEHGIEKPVINNDLPKFLVYTAIGDHIKRSAGGAAQDVFGPRYYLNKTGEIYGGVPAEKRRKIRDFFLWNLRKSSLFSQVLFPLYNYLNINYSGYTDTDLFIKIILKAKSIFEERYSGKFIVFLWLTDDSRDQEIIDLFKNLNITFFTTKEIGIVPEADLIEGDGHPSLSGHRKMGKLIFDKIKLLENN